MPEGQTVEWKSSWRDDYLKWVCGFANAQGGVLVIGKDDRGSVVGVANSKKLLEDIPNKINSSMAIVADVDLREEGGLEYLVVTVEAYPYPISYHGRYYYRSGATNRELTGNALDEFVLRKQGKTWDGVPVPRVGAGGLDIVAFREFRRKALSSKRLTEEDVALSDEALLDSLLLKEGDYIKRAAVLLFHERPEQWVIGAYVKIGYFETGADLMYMDEVHGPLITMADKVIDLLYSKYFKGLISYDGLQRIETFPVPRAACREAVLNAIVHRDYSAGVPIQIKVFPDEVIIYNSGRLPQNWTVADLLARHSSLPHNPNIANAFFRSGQIETWGRGIEKIEAACAAEGRPAPEFVATGNEVRVSFTTSVTDAGVSENVIEGVSENVIENVIEAVSDHRATDAQRAILRLVADEPFITTAAISEKIGITQRRVASSMAKLKAFGLIERVGSARAGYWRIDTPTSAAGVSENVIGSGNVIESASGNVSEDVMESVMEAVMESVMEAVSDHRATDAQRAILRLVADDPHITTAAISEKIGITQRRVASSMAKLKAFGLIERVGSARAGYWRITTPITDAGISENVIASVIEAVGDHRAADAQRAILRLVADDPYITTAAVSEKIGITQRRVASNLARLKAVGIIERVGSARAGHWRINIPITDASVSENVSEAP